MVNINIKCRSCGQKTHMGNMKYHPGNGKDLVCLDCFNAKVAELNSGSRAQYSLNMISTVKKPAKEKTLSVKDRLEGSYEPKHNSTDVTDYKCSKCNYRFKRRKSFNVHSVCPYCGNKSSNKRAAIFTDIIQGLD